MSKFKEDMYTIFEKNKTSERNFNIQYKQN